MLCLLIKFQYAHNGKGCQELCEALIKKCFSIGSMLACLIECFFSLSFPGMSRIIAGQLNDIQQFNSKIQQNLHLRLRGHVPSNHQNDRNKPLTASYSLTKAPPSKPSWQSSCNHANQSVTGKDGAASIQAPAKWHENRPSAVKKKGQDHDTTTHHHDDDVRLSSITKPDISGGKCAVIILLFGAEELPFGQPWGLG